MATGERQGRAGASAGRWSLVALELVIAASAIYGGVGLARNGLRMPVEWLEPTPFDSWLWPGLFLLMVIAAPMTTAALLEVFRSRWAFAASMVAAIAQVSSTRRAAVVYLRID